jgi:hypothetical protein
LATTEIRLQLEAARRFETIDITRRVAEEAGDVLARYRKSLYSSFHTTAGYLEPSVSRRLRHRGDRLQGLFEVFRTLFPADAAYSHDKMHLRAELSEEQREVEPRNGDSHLTFIGSGMRNCVTSVNRPDRPVYFIELDGVSAAMRRRRTTAVLAYDEEEVAERTLVRVPVSRHPHDLVEVLKDPLRFAALKSRHILDDPLGVPRKTLGYARYDFVVVMNTLMECFRLNESAVERLVAKVMAVPARRFLRSRRVSFMASGEAGTSQASLVRGTYQSPILVQWGPSERQVREIQVSLVRFR